jgi:hypothetical protein
MRQLMSIVADTDTKIKKAINEGTESEMQTADTAQRSAAYAEFNLGQQQATESAGELTPWQQKAVVDTFRSEMAKTSFMDKAVQNTLDKLYASGAFSQNERQLVIDFIDSMNADTVPADLGEKAPPGMERLVKDIKKQYPGHPEKAFATAWSIYNKQHGKTDEGSMVDESGEQDIDFIYSAIKHYRGGASRQEMMRDIARETGYGNNPEFPEMFKLALDRFLRVGDPSLDDTDDSEDDYTDNSMRRGEMGMEEGYTVVPSIDREKYTDLSSQGLEGPFRLNSGKVVYYDPKEGRYYDRETDMYLSHDEYDQHAAHESQYSPGLNEAASPAVHVFGDSAEAYDATQTGVMTSSEKDEAGRYREILVKDGDILVIPSEGIVGICSTWPVAVTKNSGNLHELSSGFSTPESIAKVLKVPLAAIQAAFQKARSMGLETIDSVNEDMNNGYHDVELADGQDFFPNGADGPVVSSVGPAGAKQGDNPEQKSMKVSEEYSELVYAYRKFLKESESSYSSVAGLTEAPAAAADLEAQENTIEVNSNNESMSLDGKLYMSATAMGIDGQPTEVGYEVDVSASAPIDWESDERPTGWDYAADDATYTTDWSAVADQIAVQAVEFAPNGTYMVGDNEVSFEEFRRTMSPESLQALVDPVNYSGILGKLAASAAEQLKPTDSD